MDARYTFLLYTLLPIFAWVGLGIATGTPRKVKAVSFNSNAIRVNWYPPPHYDEDPLVRGYRIYVQETNWNGDLLNKPKRYYVADGNAREYLVTNLQPDILYSIQVAAVTKKGEGTLSRAKIESTLGGVPSLPKLSARIIQEEPILVAEVRWSRPPYIYGRLMGYKLRFGRADTREMKEIVINPLDLTREVTKLDRAARYEFYLSAKNGLGWGQEAYTYLDTPEGGSCSYKKFSHYGVIKSPNYPGYYSSNKTCTWQFYTKPGHRIKLVFTIFKLEGNEKCGSDYMVAYDGDSDTSPILGKFCGREKSQTILSSGNQMYLVYKSDASVQKKRFKVTHTTVCGGSLLANPSNQYLFSHAEFGYQYYNRKADCDWIVRGVNDRRVKLKFLAFEVEPEKDCEFDYVEVYDGENDSAEILGKFCGNKVPPEFYSTGNSLMVRFHTDDTINTNGFSAAYVVF